jgi:hypothetical protein
MTSPALLGTAEVLLVEDDAGDVLLTREALAQHHLDVQLHVVGDGEERYGSCAAPMASLARLGPPWSCSTSTCPAAVAWKPSPTSRPTLTCGPFRWWSSPPPPAQQDILRSYQLHTNAYIVKPIDADQFSAAIGQIDDFFLTLATQPQ